MEKITVYFYSTVKKQWLLSGGFTVSNGLISCEVLDHIAQAINNGFKVKITIQENNKEYDMIYLKRTNEEN
jgi:hypothetical protein